MTKNWEVAVHVGVVPDEGWRREGEYLVKGEGESRSSYLVSDEQVVADVSTALVGVTLDAPYTFGGAISGGRGLEDMSDEEIALMSLRGRFVKFLSEQPDVADVDDHGEGIYGFRLAGTGGVSADIRLT